MTECACDFHRGGNALHCAQEIAKGTKTPCGCECHEIGLRMNVIIESCVQTILQSWDRWNTEADMVCIREQDAGCWEVEMHANLWHAVKDAVVAAAETRRQS